MEGESWNFQLRAPDNCKEKERTPPGPHANVGAHVYRPDQGVDQVGTPPPWSLMMMTRREDVEDGSILYHSTHCTKDDWGSPMEDDDDDCGNENEVRGRDPDGSWLHRGAGHPLILRRSEPSPSLEMPTSLHYDDDDDYLAGVGPCDEAGHH